MRVEVDGKWYRLAWNTNVRMRNPDRFLDGQVDAAMHGDKPERNPERWGYVPAYVLKPEGDDGE